jgi:NitT/TauT family transport system permease protein
MEPKQAVQVAPERSASPPRRMWRPDSNSWLLPAAFIVLLIVAWQLVTQFTPWFKPYILPQPWDVVARMARDPALLFGSFKVTLIEVIVGFVIGGVVGVVLALPIAYSPAVRNTLYPLIIASQAVPKIAIAPLLVVWLGLGWTPKLTVVALMVFFPVAMTSVQGFTSVDKNLIDLLRSVDAGRWQVFTKVRLPHALPHIFSGLKIGITLAVVGAVVGEWVGANSGLGYLLLNANSLLDTTLLYAALVLLVVMGVVLFALMAVLERVLMPWQEPATPTPITS